MTKPKGTRCINNDLLIILNYIYISITGKQLNARFPCDKNKWCIYMNFNIQIMTHNLRNIWGATIQGNIMCLSQHVLCINIYIYNPPHLTHKTSRTYYRQIISLPTGYLSFHIHPRVNAVYGYYTRSKSVISASILPIYNIRNTRFQLHIKIRAKCKICSIITFKSNS